LFIGEFPVSSIAVYLIKETDFALIYINLAAVIIYSNLNMKQETENKLQVFTTFLHAGFVGSYTAGLINSADCKRDTS
jgi:hypothetical protein